ncbi:winged helix-turn-helix domain-containing protein [Candidatus Shapirobacteria bacterium]|nr:winged helix-turn-helix domain-containing protein [Candidatus Shapirobacteria bacterium]
MDAVISRDEIAEILWGKESYDKYSDWSIDQMISQLRKKLNQLGISPKSLQTIRDRGYRWIG